MVAGGRGDIRLSLWVLLLAPPDSPLLPWLEARARRWCRDDGADRRRVRRALRARPARLLRIPAHPARGRARMPARPPRSNLHISLLLKTPRSTRTCGASSTTRRRRDPSTTRPGRGGGDVTRSGGRAGPRRRAPHARGALAPLECALPRMLAGDPGGARAAPGAAAGRAGAPARGAGGVSDCCGRAGTRRWPSRRPLCRAASRVRVVRRRAAGRRAQHEGRAVAGAEARQRAEPAGGRPVAEQRVGALGERASTAAEPGSGSSRMSGSRSSSSPAAATASCAGRAARRARGRRPTGPASRRRPGRRAV